MTSSLYVSLRDGLRDLGRAFSTEREPSFAPSSLPPTLPPVSPSDLTARVQAVWDGCQSDQESSSGRRVEVVRSVLDLAGRDLVIAPIVNGDVSGPAGLSWKKVHIQARIAHEAS